MALHYKSATHVKFFNSFTKATNVLHARQDETLQGLPSACFAQCELETCGSSWCPTKRNILRRNPSYYGLDDLAQLNKSDAAAQHDLWKRVFRYDTTSRRYAGNRPPTIGQVSNYLPAVFNGGEIAQYGAPLTCINSKDPMAGLSKVSLVVLKSYGEQTERSRPSCTR